MAEHTSTKLNADQQVSLDQFLLRVPVSIISRNLKNARRLVEREKEWIAKKLQEEIAKGDAGDAQQSAEVVGELVKRLKQLRTKMESLDSELHKLTRSLHARVDHLNQLYTIPSLADVKYEQWSGIRLDRMMVDYMLRQGYIEAARQLAKEKEIEELVDIDAFVACLRVEKALREEHKLGPALAWCSENKQALRKVEVRLSLPLGKRNHPMADFEPASNLEHELRLQEFIEKVRTQNLETIVSAREFAQKYLAPHKDPNFAIRAAGLLAFSPNTNQEPYKTLYSTDRWHYLADLFLAVHHQLHNIPERPLLHNVLSAGFCALKSPSCHSEKISPRQADAEQVLSEEGAGPDSVSDYEFTEDNQPVKPAHKHQYKLHHKGPGGAAALALNSICPICSTELNELARMLPYAHHSKSIVEPDAVVLPNGRVYGEARLRLANEKMGTAEGYVKDPMDQERVFREEEMKKVFIM
ncbi:CTLH/CRA C-terminal to lish motif domain-containing protein [Lineolata rhizophorae]|uniref:CTLH/CRA C-terminal to lish motif domain-containing protein n=1 Tax=Lineolata rhizophorae TaxID=578093 RepID=A0A6A6NZU5_9PEZI|nr:CTLH/CRA C-terminal to lish motif domain-containing protein [Lineolata rhizophorae]